MAERTYDRDSIEMSLLKFSETSWVRKSLLDDSDRGSGRFVRGTDICQCFGEALAQPKRRFLGGLRFDECMQKLMKEKRFNRTVVLKDGKRLERDLVTASDSEEIAGAASDLTEEFGGRGEDDSGPGCFVCRW